MALHLGKSHGRQVNQGRNALPWAALLPVALLTLCTFHAGCALSTPRDQPAVAAAKSSIETRSKDVTERLKQDVDRLIATDFHDIAALNAQLQTQLGPGESQDVMVIRAGVSGVLAGGALKRIELRSNQHAPSHATLVLDFLPLGRSSRVCPRQMLPSTHRAQTRPARALTGRCREKRQLSSLD